MSIHIESAVHERAREYMRSKYLAEFGANSLSEEMVALDRSSYIAVYARNLAFWKAHMPTINLGRATPPKLILAVHAICSNAVAELTRKLDASGILGEVQREASLLANTFTR